MKKIIIPLLGFISFISGCQNAEQDATISEIDTLREENKTLAAQLELANEKTEQLKKQVQILSAIEDQLEPEDIYNIRKINISRFTNFYDKNNDDKTETLIVYIQPTDEKGDAIKAAGTFDIQLWDLSRQADSAIIGQWHIKSDELKKMWYSSLMGANYRLPFDLTGKVENFEKTFTIKVTFTDYLTGKVFTEQKQIEPL